MLVFMLFFVEAKTTLLKNRRYLRVAFKLLVITSYWTLCVFDGYKYVLPKLFAIPLFYVIEAMIKTLKLVGILK